MDYQFPAHLWPLACPLVRYQLTVLRGVRSRPGRGRDPHHRLALSFNDFEHLEVTLRGHHDEVGGELRYELIARLAVAGITIDECGFTHLAYATKIAGAMLHRQRAQAIVAARRTLVDGAVAMVEMALDALSEKD